MQKGAVKCYPQKKEKFSPSISYGRYCQRLFWALLVFIHFITNSSVWGHLENVLLSCSSNVALNGSNARLTILPVYAMCDQSHTLMNLSFFQSIYIPKCTEHFWKESWAFVFRPFSPQIDGEGPSAWRSYWSRVWAYPEQCTSFVRNLTGKQQRAFPHSGFQTSTFTHWLLFFPADFDISLKLKLKHFKGKVHVFQNVASSVSLIQNVGLWMNQFYDMIFGVPAAKVNLFLKLGLRIPEMLTSPQIGVVQWLCLNYLSHSFHVFE